MREKVAVKLQDDAGRNGDVGVLLVNEGERVAITGYLLLRTVARSRPSHDDVTEATLGGGYPLDAV